MNEQKLKDWLAGLIPDSELTSEEVAWLQVATFEAVAIKLRAQPETATLQ